MEVMATKSFRPMHERGRIVVEGTVITVDDHYGNDLIRGGLAVKNEPKMVQDVQTKMRADFENKGLSTKTQTEEQRSQGVVGPSEKSQTLEERSSGVINAKK